MTVIISAAERAEAYHIWTSSDRRFREIARLSDDELRARGCDDRKIEAARVLRQVGIEAGVLEP